MQNRREFLKKGAALGALALMPTIASAAKKTEIKTNVKTRTLGSGKNALKVSAIGLGCIGLSNTRSVYPDKKYMIKTVHQCYDMGYRLFDTAEIYGPFINEELVGEALKGIRKEVVLTTKFGFKNGRVADGYDSTPKRIRQVIDESLKRLQTDYVDMFYQHRVDPNVPIEEVAGVMSELMKAGKILHWGVSEAPASEVRKAHAVTPLTAIQNEYSAMVRDSEDMFSVCEELGIGFVAYSPLGRGFLSGELNERSKIDPNNDTRHRLPQFQAENIVKNWALIDVLKSFGDTRGLSAAQVALAWVLAQRPYIVPIPGTAKAAHAYENLTASDYEFAGDELANLTKEILKVELVAKKG